jgi:2-dehydro-3-deoxyphosphogluconate aldolase/(4S)-4-hydroxy-2-oxoglutarate aldolase
MHRILEQIKTTGVVPVIKIEDVTQTQPLVEALLLGGIPCAEVTFRTETAEEAIKTIHKMFPKITLGAGTVLTVEQAERAKAAGAAFVVSPGFNPKVVDWCITNDLLIIPGCATPSDMEQAIERGLDTVKFFPAEQAGGIDYIKAVAAPYTMLHFVPTGGIGINNLKDYLSFDKVIACGGSWMVKHELINGRQYKEITRLCNEAVVLVKEIRGGK